MLKSFFLDLFVKKAIFLWRQVDTEVGSFSLSI